jgi:hypothetical protein
MYEQMFRDIAQQYTVVWQSAAALLGSFAIAALAEKNILSLDIAISVISLICVWFLLNIVECSYWYNRNLCIIANIERQFLTKSDLGEIHYYFGSHRPKNRMTSHLKNQCFLAWFLLAIVIAYHFIERVLPGLYSCPTFEKFDLSRCLPYIVTIASILYLRHRSKLRDVAYEEFLKNSPGASIDASGVSFGVGHGHTP